MPSNPQIDAPQTLAGLFPPDSDEEEEEGEPDPCYEVQSMVLADYKLQIRQFAYHSHNANRVWPGTFNLADYLLAKTSDAQGAFQHEWGRVLELGTATGLLAIRLALASTQHSDATSVCCTSIVTSDVVDDDALVHENLKFNYELNGVLHPPPHVPHTWGTGFDASVAAAGIQDFQKPFDTIVASDILLYVSAYGALVETLKELMAREGPQTRFIMSWNRRMKESAEFFTRMEQAGFECRHEGKCIYTFERVLD
jgi:predicted nicotinamide N-methyase